MNRLITLALIVAVLSGCVHKQRRDKFPGLYLPTPAAAPATAPVQETVAKLPTSAPANTTNMMILPVRWHVATDAKTFYGDYAYTNRRIVALFGSEGCGPCHMVYEWWQKHDRFGYLPFVYWETSSKYDPWTGEDTATDVGRGMYLATHSREETEMKNASFPVCAIVEGASNKAPFTKVVKWSGAGFKQCTDGLLQALQSGI